jgi:hypothetical protein
MWVKISWGALAACVALGVYSLVLVKHEPMVLPPMPYAGVKKKAFPWGDGKTPLFGAPHKPDDAHHGKH